MQFSRTPVTALLLLCLVPMGALSQAPPEVTVGFGVDTSNATVAAIVRTAAEYFRSP